jgi:hypothetical protein
MKHYIFLLLITCAYLTGCRSPAPVLKSHDRAVFSVSGLPGDPRVLFALESGAELVMHKSVRGLVTEYRQQLSASDAAALEAMMIDAYDDMSSAHQRRNTFDGSFLRIAINGRQVRRALYEHYTYGDNSKDMGSVDILFDNLRKFIPEKQWW